MPERKMNIIRSVFMMLALGLLLSACGNKADETRLKAAEKAYYQGDFKTAAEVFQVMAERGNARAQFFLAQIYLNGNGMPRDYARALKWAIAAADQKDPEAQFTLGEIYESGKGVPQDFVQAHMWYSLSASTGDEQAIRRKAELEIKKMTGAQIEQSKQLELKWIEAHKD
jgi:TPR repeat protein